MKWNPELSLSAPGLRYTSSGLRLLPSVWDQLSGQVFLGSETFIKRLQRLADKTAIGEIPRAQRRPQAKPLSYYQNKHRDAKAAMVAAYATGD